MIVPRRSADRGRTRTAWLDSAHTFSFGEYHDPEHLGYGPLRVINEDRVQPGGGFPPHSHRDMEIVTYVIAGALEHKDSLGTGSVIRPGDVQRMRAGNGITHSEYNPSDREPVHFLQIWIVPRRRGGEPSYEQRSFGPTAQRNRLRLVCSADGRDDSVTVDQVVDLFAASLDAGTTIAKDLAAGRRAWIQVITGTLSVNGELLAAGDGAAVHDEAALRIVAREPADLLLFELPGG
jgi:redox-sensitive bicupin YhaK (pirin superfamily)